MTHHTSLELYFQEIKSLQPLTPAREVMLARRIREGDRSALDELLYHNLRFVVSVAKRYQGNGLSLEDLINEGNLGLIKAALRYDETRGFKFISYAVWWIRQSILEAISENSRLVRLPQNVIGQLNRVNRMTDSLTQEFEREPTTAEVAQEMHISQKDIINIFSLGARHISLDAPLGDEQTTLSEIISDRDDRPETKLMKESVHREIQRALRTLDPREARVIKLYFGLGCDRPSTLEEIGNQFHLTRERVRQVKERAIRKLRHASRAYLLLGYRS